MLIEINKAEGKGVKLRSLCYCHTHTVQYSEGLIFTYPSLRSREGEASNSGILAMLRLEPLTFLATTLSFNFLTHYIIIIKSQSKRWFTSRSDQKEEHSESC